MTLSYPSYHPEEFVKLTHVDNINRDFQYKEGLNEDVYDLNEMVECDKGGLYFSRSKDIMKWADQYDNCNIWRVTIPEGEKVIEYDTKLKAKRIILTDCQPLYNNPELCKLAVQQNGSNCLHTRYRSQLTRTLGSNDSRRSCKGLTRCSLPHCKGQVGYCRSSRQKAWA